MKKLLFSLSLLASLATVAGESTVEATAQVFGVLPITSAATNVIVAVPWVAASNTDTNKISVAEIIKTANLTKGDWIRVWNAGTTNSSFKVWDLVENSSGVLEWRAGTVVDSKGAEKTGTSTETYLERGEAIILHRKDPGTGTGNTFYVYGQYKSTGATGITCVLGTTNAPAYTLIAPPKATDVGVNSITWNNVNTLDSLVIADTNGVSQSWGWVTDESKWGNVKSYTVKKSGKRVRTTEFIAPPDIKAGTGAWYISRGGDASGAAAPTATWN